MKTSIGQCPKCGASDVELFATPDHPTHSHLCAGCGVKFFTRPEDRLVRPLPPDHEEQINLVPVSDARGCYRRYKDQLTDAERIWMENFFAAYYRGDKEAWKALGVDLRTSEGRELVDEQVSNSHRARRATPNGKTRTFGYTPADYAGADISPEDAMLTAFSAGKNR